MEETLTENDRGYLDTLNQDRKNRERSKTKTDQSSTPDIVTYIFLEGLIGLPGDLLKLIVGIGTVLALPFTFVMWFWRTFSSRFKKSPVQKILTNGLIQGMPFSNTFFITSCYIEETKLGKAVLGKFSKSMRLMG